MILREKIPDSLRNLYTLIILESLNFYTFGSKKVSLSGVKKYPGQSYFGPLLTTGQKYAQVGSGHVPSLRTSKRVQRRQEAMSAHSEHW